MASKRHHTQEDLHYRTLKLVQEQPDMSQRDLADRLGISYGSVNYLLKALISEGLVKLGRFKDSKHKFGYVYLLTPAGISHKGLIAQRFLQRKLLEYAQLKNEIDALRADTETQDIRSPQPAAGVREF